MRVKSETSVQSNSLKLIRRAQVSDGFDSLVQRYGRKAAAQLLFKSLGLFEGDLHVFEQGMCRSYIRQVLVGSDLANRVLSIRFSRGEEMNLPRGFAKNINECIDFIEQHREFGSAIVHELIRPETSYEVYFDLESLFVQLVPGIWEMDNRFPPSTIRECSTNVFALYRYPYERSAKFLDAKGQFILEMRRPFSFDELEQKSRKLTSFKPKMQIACQSFNPLLARLLETSDGRWFFFNTRPTPKLSFEGLFTMPQYHVVDRIEDLDAWDGNSRILVTMTVSRERGAEFLEMARRLAKMARNVYVRYGLLSHPAVILREFNINVLPYRDQYEPKIMTLTA